MSTILQVKFSAPGNQYNRRLLENKMRELKSGGDQQMAVWMQHYDHWITEVSELSEVHFSEDLLNDHPQKPEPEARAIQNFHARLQARVHGQGRRTL